MSSYLKITSKITLLVDENILLFQSKKVTKTIKMEPQMTHLLIALFEAKNEVVTKASLVNTIWKGNAFVGNSALRKNVYKLRSILKNVDNELKIVTIPKKGYKLLIPSKRINIGTIISYKYTTYAIASMFILFLVLRGHTNVEEEEDIELSPETSQVLYKTDIEEEEEEIIFP